MWQEREKTNSVPKALSAYATSAASTSVRSRWYLNNPACVMVCMIIKMKVVQLIINMWKRARSTLRPTWFDQHYMVGIVLFNFFTTLHKPWRKYLLVFKIFNLASRSRYLTAIDYSIYLLHFRFSIHIYLSLIFVNMLFENQIN